MQCIASHRLRFFRRPATPPAPPPPPHLLLAAVECAAVRVSKEGMAAGTSPLPPLLLCKQRLVLVHSTKPPPLVARRRPVSVRAAPPRQQQHQQRRPSSPRNNKRGRLDPPPRPARRPPPRAPPLIDYYDDDDQEDEEEEERRFAGGTRAAAMPKPPAGFVLDDKGRCIAAASKRIVTIIDDANNRPLECIIRRVFRSSQDHDCMLLCPVDMPVQVLKSTNFSGWIAVCLLIPLHIISYKQVQYFPFYKLYKQNLCRLTTTKSSKSFLLLPMPLQECICTLSKADSGDGGDGVPFEGVEICCFNLDGAHYMIYTPVDPLLFVAVKDKDGVLHIAEDDLMDDPAVVDAIDEETEFTALVEEEEALLETVLGER
ncbi:unnamed protein product [Urochloa decumbens]|uniref:Uncharacterized protein n=1 Tax=Urochloa decumbens TaxID=240449 RepID=A0ABC9GU90_9POAL